MAITTFCADADVQKILSSAGVALRGDDDAGALQWAREEAALEMNEYCLKRYSPATLAANDWVKRKSAWLAAYRMCQRRGNKMPETIRDEIDGRDRNPGLRARLEEVRKGLRSIPDAVERKADVPVLTNQRVRLQPVPQAVAERGKSTGNPQGFTPFDDQTDGWFDWNL